MLVSAIFFAQIGTPPYMAPEPIIDQQHEMQAHPFACEVCSYDIMAWQLVAGERSYAAARGNIHLLFIRVIKGLRPGLERWVKGGGWPRCMPPLLRKCWAANAAERPDFPWVLGELSANKAGFVRSA